MLERGVNGFRGSFSFLHSYRSLIQYSTSSAASKDGVTNPLMVGFLVKSVGFSEEEAVSFVTSNSKVSRRFKSTEKSELVVNFLKNSGFDVTHIREVVSSIPIILRTDVEKTLKPKITVLQELGFCGSELRLIISRDPYVLCRSVNAYIVPAIETLKSVLGSNEQLCRFILISKKRRLLSSIAVKNFPDNLLLLQTYGFQNEQIKPLLFRRPYFLLQKRTRWVEKIVKGVEEKLGIPRTSSMFKYGVSALSCINEDKFKSLVEVFRTCGWSETEISTLIRRQPLIMNLSVSVLRVKLKYLMEDLGYGSDYLATRHVLLSLSLDKRVVPRNAVLQALKEKQELKYYHGFYTAVKMTESKFSKIYVLPHKEKFPELYEYYAQATGCSLSKT